MWDLSFGPHQIKNDFSGTMFPIVPGHEIVGRVTAVGHHVTKFKVLEVHAFNVVMGRRSFAGSNIGGISETQEMLDFCARNNIVADIEHINIQDVNKAFERLEKGDVKYRFVIDMASLQN